MVQFNINPRYSFYSYRRAQCESADGAIDKSQSAAPKDRSPFVRKSGL